jgi:hypothetical protein
LEAFGPCGCLTLPQVLCYQGELIESGLQVLHDLGGDHVGGREVGGVLQAVVFEPENVQAGLVAFDQFVISEGMEAVTLLTLVAILCVVAGYEIIQVLAAQRVGLQREVLVGAEVVDPQLLGPGLFAGDTAGKEQHVGLHALRVEDAGGQPRARTGTP